MTQPTEIEAEVIPPPNTSQNTKLMLSVPANNSPIPRPVVTPTEAKVIIAEWEELKKAIGMESDIRRETRYSKDGPVEVAYYKKSYWRKAATFLNISVEAVQGSENFRTIGEGASLTKLASVVYVASAKNGRRVVGDGHCGTDEGGKAKWSAANLLATAHSRAYNRAVSNFIGGGEVSADEIDEEGLDHKTHTPQAPSRQTTPAPKPAAPTGNGDGKVALQFATKIQNAQDKDALMKIGGEIAKLDKPTQELIRSVFVARLDSFKAPAAPAEIPQADPPNTKED
jgi:hypothetical protein